MAGIPNFEVGNEKLAPAMLQGQLQTGSSKLVSAMPYRNALESKPLDLEVFNFKVNIWNPNL
jgi:hypothetical protein